MARADPVDRSKYPTRKIALQEKGRESDLGDRDPGELVAMVEELTRQGWTFKDGRWDEPRLRRDIVRVVRRGR
jgi:hypothetical protein